MKINHRIIDHELPVGYEWLTLEITEDYVFVSIVREGDEYKKMWFKRV